MVGKRSVRVEQSTATAKHIARIGNRDNIIHVEGGLRATSRIARAEDKEIVRWRENDAG